MTNPPYYTKLAKIEGDLTGATIDWDWEWSEDSEPPNVVPSGRYCIVTNRAIEDKSAVLPNQGTLTLIPSVTCNANTVELSPISLTISLNFVEPPAPCCEEEAGWDWDLEYECNTIYTEYVRGSWCRNLQAEDFPNCYWGYYAFYGPYPFNVEVLGAENYTYQISGLIERPDGGYYRRVQMISYDYDPPACICFRPYGMGYHNCAVYRFRAIDYPGSCCGDYEW